jgi:hypothetical protein
MKKAAILLLFLASSAIYSATADGILKKVYIDNKNNVHVVFPNEKEKKLTTDGLVSGVKFSSNKRTAIWLVPNRWIAEGDVIPGGSKLAVYHAGKLQHITCEPFVRDYWFWMDGNQIAVDCGGRHFAGTLILYDAANLRKIDSFFQADIPEEKRPDWSKSESNSDENTIQ